MADMAVRPLLCTVAHHAVLAASILHPLDQVVQHQSSSHACRCVICVELYTAEKN